MSERSEADGDADIGGLLVEGEVRLSESLAARVEYDEQGSSGMGTCQDSTYHLNIENKFRTPEVIGFWTKNANYS